jgi:hypothetical protein
VINFTLRPLFLKEKTPVPIQLEAGGAPETVWKVY